MCHLTQSSFRSRVEAVRRSDELVFDTLISKETIRSVFGKASSILDSRRIYDTATTVWVFLSQVMSFHHGCVAAVSKLNAFRVARGLPACSSETGAYCAARDRLDEAAVQRLITATAQSTDAQVPDSWHWLGHRVVTADGTTVTMADTPENQAAYPQLRSQQPGCGFPILRMVVFFSLASGVVRQMAVGRYRGKLTHEVSLFREIDHVIEQDDVFLADRAYAGWFDMARLMMRGAHVVVRKHQMRKSDFRKGIRHGHDDHRIRLDRPPRPEWMSEEEYLTYPAHIEIREVRVTAAHRGFRTRVLIVHTSLLDTERYTKPAIAELYRRRWQAELYLRNLKTHMQMDHLRCKLPHRVRNELRMHLIAYNLIRQVMVEAAIARKIEPSQISFKTALTHLMEMLPILLLAPDSAEVCQLLFRQCCAHRAGHRGGRYEPRVRKRRPKSYPLMTKPRSSYKPRQAQGLR